MWKRRYALLGWLVWSYWKRRAAPAAALARGIDVVEECLILQARQVAVSKCGTVREILAAFMASLEAAGVEVGPELKGRLNAVVAKMDEEVEYTARFHSLQRDVDGANRRLFEVGESNPSTEDRERATDREREHLQRSARRLGVRIHFRSRQRLQPLPLIRTGGSRRVSTHRCDVTGSRADRALADRLLD